jgi:DNA topoisomerase-1
LFQYVDDEGTPRPIASSDVNDYLRDITGKDVTAKDFRTWMGTLLATVALAELPPPRRDVEARKCVARVCEIVGEHLGNTPTVCRGSYVHPEIVDAYQGGSLNAQWRQAPVRASKNLLTEEQRLLALLRPRRRRERAAA